MEINLWVSTDEIGKWLIKNTILKDLDCKLNQFIESDSNNADNFHRLPEAIKRILYLDAVDVIIEINKKPIFALEISQEAGSGHNVFQRFARIVAAAENNVPVAYIYPEAKFVSRQSSNTHRWDRLNPNIFTALDRVMWIHRSPALFYYYPTEFNGNMREIPVSPKGLINDDIFESCPDSSDSEMKEFFKFVNIVIAKSINNDNNLLLINDEYVKERRIWMQEQFSLRNARINRGSPHTATMEVPTSSLLKFIKKYVSEDYEIGELLSSREQTIIYQINPTEVRADPYAGVLSSLDYLITRIGEKTEDRSKNLVLAWFKAGYDEEKNEILVDNAHVSINEFMSLVYNVRSPNKCLLAYDNFDDLSSNENNISRYFMQLNHSCRFTKRKDFRIYSVFADAILFKDGCFWKDG